MDYKGLQAAVIAMSALLVAMLGVPSAGFGETAGVVRDHHRVVMHLNSGDEKVQHGALNNIRHLYQEIGRKHLRMELVAHGAGLTLFTKNATTRAAELAQLKAAYGIEFTACSNTMKAMNLTREDLVEQVDRTVPAMVRLMELQEQGWTYIKP